jgi:hypothetical protein
MAPQIYQAPQFIKTKIITPEIIEQETTKIYDSIKNLNNAHKNSPIFLCVGFVIGALLKHVNSIPNSKSKEQYIEKLQELQLYTESLMETLPEQPITENEIHFLCIFAKQINDLNLYRQIEEIIRNR